VEITFAEAISDITGLQMHSPGGGRRRDGVLSEITTKICVRFELSLAGMRHQEFRTVPDAADDGKDTESRALDPTSTWSWDWSSSSPTSVTS
jgi:hypothetical protein